MSKWDSIEDCEYPICDTDEAVPVWVVYKNEVVEAWYRNPSLDVCWFEDDNGNILEGVHLYMETLSIFGVPELPEQERVYYG